MKLLFAIFALAIAQAEEVKPSSNQNANQNANPSECAECGENMGGSGMKAVYPGTPMYGSNPGAPVYSSGPNVYHTPGTFSGPSVGYSNIPYVAPVNYGATYQAGPGVYHPPMYHSGYPAYVAAPPMAASYKFPSSPCYAPYASFDGKQMPCRKAASREYPVDPTARYPFRGLREEWYNPWAFAI